MSSLVQKIKEDFAHYLLVEVGTSGRGPISTYIRALDVLGEALKATPDLTRFSSDVWLIESPNELMLLRQFVIEQQHSYVLNGAGIFSQLKNVGSCNFKNRFCSAALKQLAAYRQTRRYEGGLQDAFTNATQGIEVAVAANNVRLKTPTCFVPENIDPKSKEGKEAVAMAKHRINQSVFRRWIVGLYGNECCVTGLNIPEILRASHIVPWAGDASNRMNPCNGLCLSATYDAAFDRHLISFDNDYRMILSKRIRDYCTREICSSYFAKYEGCAIRLPSRFLPDRELLAKHRDLLVS